MQSRTIAHIFTDQNFKRYLRNAFRLSILTILGIEPSFSENFYLPRRAAADSIALRRKFFLYNKRRLSMKIRNGEGRDNFQK